MCPLRWIQNMIKRFVDIVGALLSLAVFGVPMLVIAAAIKIDTPGPVLYRGKRVGRYGRLFHILKFRTMVVNAERLGGPSTAGDDPRITTAGRRLRKYKLDELPQLLNVLAGSMSLVGPRPEVQQYVDTYTEEEEAILSVRPGITDYASLWNSDEGAVLAGHPDPEEAYLKLIRPTKLRLQLKYVREQSLVTDMKIVLATITSIAVRRRPPALDAIERAGGGQ